MYKYGIKIINNALENFKTIKKYQDKYYIQNAYIKISYCELIRQHNLLEE